MSSFRRGHEDDEDLVVLARRRLLSEPEQRELEADLEAEPTLRTDYSVGRAFDDVAFVQAGDEALIARVVDQTLGAGKRRPLTGRWRVAAAVAAGFLLVTGAATAYRAGIGPRLRRTLTAPAPGVASPAPRARARARHTSESAAPVLLDDPVPAEPAVEPHVSPDERSAARPAVRAVRASPQPEEQPPAPTPNATSSGVTDETVTAPGLFRRAGAARRAGGLAEACALYRDLQARFPGAEEARLSHVSLGKLLLEMGQPQEAERHFEIYLAGGTDALAAEAAFGRAQAFERMGRPREERQAWLGLLRDFPGSVYAGAARRRIAALEASGDGVPEPAGELPGDVPSSAR